MVSVRSLSTVLLTLALVACGDTPTGDAIGPEGPSFASSGPVLIECPVDSALSAEGTIDALGGSVKLQNHEIALPEFAVLTSTKFRLEAPVSNYMELSVTANDMESFQFEKLVRITIDYSRCTRSNIDKADLSVWQIDPVTKALLQNMGGVDDKTNRTITFETDHLSTYSIAE